MGRSWSEEICFVFLVDEENILARPLRSSLGLPELFLLSGRLGRAGYVVDISTLETLLGG